MVSVVPLPIGAPHSSGDVVGTTAVPLVGKGVGMAEEIELASWDPELAADPYQVIARLREESPICRVVIDGLPTWLITRYDEVRAALSDPRLSVDPARASAAARTVPWVAAITSPGLARHLLRTDPPEHTRLKRLVSQAFTPRRVEALRPRIQQIGDDLLAVFLPRGRADLVTEFAQPLPMTVIAELLGIPVADRAEFARLTNLYGGVDEGDAQRIGEALAVMRVYLSALIEGKERAAPADAESGDLLDGLIAARDEGGRLDHEELLAMTFVLVVAGYETTVSLIGNGALALLRNPGQLAALRADPRLIGPAIEELLRYDGPIKVNPAIRFATVDMPIGDVVIPAGDPVMVSYAAADRDPAQFPDPDRLDIGRRDSSAHLAFSHGLHYCLGAPLARAEGQIAISALLNGCPDLALAADPADLAWRRSRLVRGVKHLPVTFTAAPA
jgi:cytochrome P450